MGKCKFTGGVNIQNGPHGQGTAVNEYGWRYRYEGTFKDGSLVKGKQFFSGALHYEGEFSGGTRHGMGTEFHPDGYVDTGRWEKGQGLVDGTRTFPDGTVYTGRYVWGNLVDGTRTSPNGTVDTGRFEKGGLVDGTRTFPNGTVRKRVNGKWL